MRISKNILFYFNQNRQIWQKNISIEESVEQWAKEQLNGVKLYPKTNFINPQIEKTLKASPSKSGKEGGNYPDIKCLISTPNGEFLVMIEVKGTKDALEIRRKIYT